MKKTIKLMAVLLTVISTAGFASGNGSDLKDTEKAPATINVLPGSDVRKFKLLYVGTAGQVGIKIYRNKSTLVHSEKIQNETGFSKSFDLKNLPSGKYFIKVTDTNGATWKELNPHMRPIKQERGVVLRKLKAKGKYNLLVANNIKPMDVKIVNEKDAVIFAETIEATGGFSKTYDLTKVRAQKISFLVNQKNEMPKRLTIQ